MEYDKPLSMANHANQILDHIFTQPHSMHHYHLLMGLYDNLTSLKIPYASYKNFFNSKDYYDKMTTNFAFEIDLPPWQYQTMPKNAYYTKQAMFVTKELMDETGHNFSKMNPLS
jgi:hypothetical protein